MKVVSVGIWVEFDVVAILIGRGVIKSEEIAKVFFGGKVSVFLLN